MFIGDPPPAAWARSPVRHRSCTSPLMPSARGAPRHSVRAGAFAKRVMECAPPSFRAQHCHSERSEESLPSLPVSHQPSAIRHRDPARWNPTRSLTAWEPRSGVAWGAHPYATSWRLIAETW